MIYTISNDALSVSVDSMGAQLRSVQSKDGTEYLWQGDGRYWADSAPVLFPYIARLYDGRYTYMGKRYNMGIHGFAAACEFTVESLGGDSVTLAISENESTLSQYPFRFKLSICYRLSGSSLRVHYTVQNKDDKLMPFALGGHPGFNVPLGPSEAFSDYYLSFDEACAPLRIGFTDELFLSGEDVPYPLEEGRIIRLRHELFDDDAIILSKTAKAVSLECAAAGRVLTVDFPGFDYLGIWHAPKTDAPYVCIEPWSSLPSRQGIVEELSEKEDMIKLKPSELYQAQWCLSIYE